MARICLCLLCGLPGAGKSTFVQTLTQRLQKVQYRVYLFNFDVLGIIPELDGRDALAWKDKRRGVLRDIDELVAGIHGGEDGDLHVIIVDDNMYYRSMRSEVARIAARHTLGYVLLYVATPVLECIARDAGRGQPVGEAVIQAMAARFEEPSPSIRWEARTVYVTDSTAEVVLTAVDAIACAMADPLYPAPAKDDEVLARARAATDASLLHQVDLALRRAAGGVIGQFRTRRGAGSARAVQEYAGWANGVRVQILEHVRRGECARGEQCGGDMCDHMEAANDVIGYCTRVFVEETDSHARSW